VTPGTALVLLGFGLGALVVVGGSGTRDIRVSESPRERADALRSRTIEAQAISARASQAARDLMDQWSRAEEAARKTES
jgi:hypothetical protein